MERSGIDQRQILRERDLGKYPGGRPEIAKGRPIPPGRESPKKGRIYLYEVYTRRGFSTKRMRICSSVIPFARMTGTCFEGCDHIPAAVLSPLVLVPDILGDENLFDIAALMISMISLIRWCPWKIDVPLLQR